MYSFPIIRSIEILTQKFNKIHYSFVLLVNRYFFLKQSYGFLKGNGCIQFCKYPIHPCSISAKQFTSKTERIVQADSMAQVSRRFYPFAQYGRRRGLLFRHVYRSRRRFRDFHFLPGRWYRFSLFYDFLPYDGFGSLGPCSNLQQFIQFRKFILQFVQTLFHASDTPFQDIHFCPYII